MRHPLLDLGQRPVLGHRGNCAHAPENTLESFRQAITLGVDALEFDVRLSRDGYPVVVHDATVTRTTGATGATGNVSGMSLAALQELDAGATFTRDGGTTHPYRGRGIVISTLEEVLVATAPVPVLIEIKVAEAAAAVGDVIERLGAHARCVVASFDPRALDVFLDRGIPVGATSSQVARLLLPAFLGRRYARLPFQVMSIPPVHNGIPLPLGALARAIAPAGVGVQVWTVNSPRQALRLWSAGVQGILSDDPAAILRARTEFGGVGTRVHAGS